MRGYAWILLTVLVCAHPFGAAETPLTRYRLQDCDKKLLAMVKRGPQFLARDAIPVGALPDAATTQADIAVLLQLQATRTAADVTAIQAEVGDLAPLFLRQLPDIVQKRPAVLHALRATAAEVEFFLFAEKFALLRPRPHQIDARIHPAIAVPHHPAYPSGHAGTARALALVAARFAPAQRAELHAYGDAVGRRREIAGVHYPSDTAEGQRIGQLVAAKLLANPGFLLLIDAAKPPPDR